MDTKREHPTGYVVLIGKGLDAVYCGPFQSREAADAYAIEYAKPNHPSLRYGASPTIIALWRTPQAGRDARKGGAE